MVQNNKIKKFLVLDSDGMKHRSSLFWVVIKHMLVVVYQLFGTVYRSNFHGSKRLRLLDA